MTEVLETVVSTVVSAASTHQQQQQESGDFKPEAKQQQSAIDVEGLRNEPPDVSYDAMFHEHESMKPVLRKCTKGMYYYTLMIYYTFYYIVFGVPLIFLWAFISSTSAFLLSYVLRPFIMILQIWGSVLLIPLRSFAKYILKEPLSVLIRAVFNRRI